MARRLARRGLAGSCCRRSDHDFRVVDIWESEDAARSFGERLTPILREVGVEEPVEVYSAYAFVSA
jgi:hypothetical protein